MHKQQKISTNYVLRIVKFSKKNGPVEEFTGIKFFDPNISRPTRLLIFRSLLKQKLSSCCACRIHRWPILGTISLLQSVDAALPCRGGAIITITMIIIMIIFMRMVMIRRLAEEGGFRPVEWRWSSLPQVTITKGKGKVQKRQK